MVEPLRHRQTKGADTDMLSLTSPRHVSTLRNGHVPHTTAIWRIASVRSWRRIGGCSPEAGIQQPSGASRRDIRVFVFKYDPCSSVSQSDDFSLFPLESAAATTAAKAAASVMIASPIKVRAETLH